MEPVKATKSSQMSKLFDSLKEALEDALAFARGEPNGCVVHVPEAEQDQRRPPKPRVEGSIPSGDAN